MPMYEYKCSGCGVEFEMMRKFSDAPVTECAECGAVVEKLISKSSFQLKGGGWDADGYSSAGNSNDKKGGSACDGAKPECAGCPAADSSSS